MDEEPDHIDFPDRHGLGEPTPLPSEPVPPDPLPDEILKDYYVAEPASYWRVGGEGRSATGYYVRVVAIDFDETPFSRWILWVADQAIAAAAAEALRRVYDLNSEPHPTRFACVPGDRMDRVDRLLAGRDIAAEPPGEYLRTMRLEATSLLRELERGAADAPQPRVDERMSRTADADATAVVDAAAQALMRLIDRCDAYARGHASRDLKDAAHRAYQSAAADVLAEYGRQRTFDAFDDALNNVRIAAGGTGRLGGPEGERVRSAAADELAELRFAALTRARANAAAAAMQTVMPFAAAATGPAGTIPPGSAPAREEVPDPRSRDAPPDAGAGKPPTPTAADPGAAAQQLTTDQKIMLAVAELERDPTLSQKAIAAAVGVSPSTLSESPRFQAAKKVLVRCPPPAGFRRDDGGLEAVGEAGVDGPSV